MKRIQTKTESGMKDIKLALKYDRLGREISTTYATKQYLKDALAAAGFPTKEANNGE